MLLIDINREERFKFIDFLLLFKGCLSRKEIVNRFGIGEATASRVISEYMFEYPGQIEFLGPRNGYVATKGFRSAFIHDAEAALVYLSTGNLSFNYKVKTYSVEMQDLYFSLDSAKVASVTRQIVRNVVFELEYVTLTKGNTKRKCVAHSVFKSCGAWYFRALDIDKNEYRILKFSRVVKVVPLTEEAKYKNVKSKDDEWNQFRRLIIVPHPKAPQIESNRMDLSIDQDFREILVCEAILSFVLIDMRVDCSANATLRPNEYPYYLKNRSDLESLQSMSFAPGIKPTSMIIKSDFFIEE